jgi:hypothetical protein
VGGFPEAAEVRAASAGVLRLRMRIHKANPHAPLRMTECSGTPALPPHTTLDQTHPERVFCDQNQDASPSVRKDDQGEGKTVAFDLNKLNVSKGAVADLATQKTVQLLSDLNLVLGMLPDAGYEVGEMEVELGITPKVTVGLKLGRAPNEGRLKAILEKMDNAMLSAIVTELIQASKLQDAVSVETLELKDVKVSLTAVPNVSLQWKQKVAANKLAA